VKFSHFFIKRPIFAGVLSALIFIVGYLSMRFLPISEYPEVTPPTIVVQAAYPGANPQTIAETVAAPLEQAINGVENSLYMFSQATGDGVMTLTVTFKLGTDVDNAQVQVQNRVSQALPKLPEEVRRLVLRREPTRSRRVARVPLLAGGLLPGGLRLTVAAGLRGRGRVGPVRRLFRLLRLLLTVTPRVGLLAVPRGLLLAAGCRIVAHRALPPPDR